MTPEVHVTSHARYRLWQRVEASGDRARLVLAAVAYAEGLPPRAFDWRIQLYARWKRLVHGDHLQVRIWRGFLWFFDAGRLVTAFAVPDQLRELLPRRARR